METIAEAKSHLKANWIKGTDCPCCGQYVRLYPVLLNGSMVRSLIELYKLGDGYHHVNEFDAWSEGYAGGKFAKVKYWGLAEDMDNTNPDKRTSGMWKITQKGKEFVQRQITVPSHARLYNRKFFGYEGNNVSIDDVIGTKFSYEELMNGTS